MERPRGLRCFPCAQRWYVGTWHAMHLLAPLARVHGACARNVACKAALHTIDTGHQHSASHTGPLPRICMHAPQHLLFDGPRRLPLPHTQQVLSSGGPALAARSGGRIGGSSFSSGRSSSSFSSSSSRSSSFSSSYSTPRSYAAPSTYYSPLSRSSVVTHHSTYMTTPSVGVTFGIPMGGYPSTYAPGFGAGDFLTVAAIVAGVFAIASVAGRLEGLKSGVFQNVTSCMVPFASFCWVGNMYGRDLG